MDAANNSESCMLSLKWTSFSCNSTWLLICICLLLRKKKINPNHNNHGHLYRLFNQELIGFMACLSTSKKKKSTSSELTLMFYTVNLFYQIFLASYMDIFFFFYLSCGRLFLCMQSLTLCVHICFLVNFPKDSPGDYSEAGCWDCNDRRSM